MGRVRVVDTLDLARRDREVFHDSRNPKQVRLVGVQWPRRLVEIGEGWGILYRSDKWNTVDNYKHLHESDWRMFVSPTFKLSFDDGQDLRQNPDLAPVYDVEGEMPRHVAYLGKCMGAQGILNDGRMVHIEIPGAHWAAARVPGDEGHAVIFAYSDAIHLVIVGEQLGIERDGIVG
jgi:hypothetical protein